MWTYYYILSLLIAGYQVGRCESSANGTTTNLGNSAEGVPTKSPTISNCTNAGCIDCFANGSWNKLGNSLEGRLFSKDFEEGWFRPCINYYENFGASISSSADGLTIAVGAPNGGNYSLFPSYGIQGLSGQVQVYQHNVSSNRWEQLGQEIEAGQDDYDFGSAVVMSGDGTTIVVVSGYRVTVFKYKLSINKWEQVGSELLNRHVNIWYGTSVDMSSDGSFVAIYMYEWSPNPSDTDGMVRFFMYSESSNQWEQVGSDIRGEYRSGVDNRNIVIDMSEDGTTIAIATLKKTYKTATIFVFRLGVHSNQWEQLGADISGIGSGSGLDMSADGTILTVIAVRMGKYSDGTEFVTRGRGRVYKYNPSSLQWEQLGGDLDVVAGSLALSADGSTIAVGIKCPMEGQNPYLTCVSVYRFDCLSSQWYQIGYFYPRMPSFRYYSDADNFGESIAISADGTVVSVGAPRHSDLANYVDIYRFDQGLSTSVPVDAPMNAPVNSPISVPNCTNAGCIDCFVNGTLNKLGNSLEGRVFSKDLEEGWFPYNHVERFGSSVSTSADGLTIAVGARDGGNYTIFPSEIRFRGQVQVYQHNASSNRWEQLGQDLEDGQDDYDFGSVVVMSGDGTTIVVVSGYRVTVFKYKSSMKKWEQVGLDLLNRLVNNWYGTSADISSDGSLIAISIYEWDPINMDDDEMVDATPPARDGMVRFFMYSESSNQWEQVGSDVRGENISIVDYRYSESIVIDMSDDGTTIAIATLKRTYADPFSDEFEETATIFVYKLNVRSNQWEQLGGDISGFGAVFVANKALELSSDGSTLAVPAVEMEKYSDGKEYVTRGRGRVYKYNPSSLQWEQLGGDLDDVHGSLALSADGSTIGVGILCPKRPGQNPYRSCVSVHRFDCLSSQWYQIGLLYPRIPSYTDSFGASIDISADGTIVSVGAPGDMELANYVDIYRFDQGLPSPVPVDAPMAAPLKSPISVPIKAPLATKAPVLSPMMVPIVVPTLTKTPTNRFTPTPVVAPVKVPLSVPVVVPVAAPVATTSPTTSRNCSSSSGSDNMVTFWLYNSRTDRMVGAITNGTIITNPPPMNRTNIEAVIACNDVGARNNRTVVEIQLYNSTTGSNSGNTTTTNTTTTKTNDDDDDGMMMYRRVERYAKYFLFGDNHNNGNIYHGRIVVPGTYRIRVIVNRTMISPFTTFTISS